MKSLKSVSLPPAVQHQLTQLRQAYESRAPREQRVLKILALVVMLLLGWSLVWQPVWNWRESARDRYAQESRLLSWIQANEPQLQQRGAQSSRASLPAGGDWSGVVSRTLGAAGLTMKGMVPEGSDAVRITLENQPFSAVAGWLAGVNQTLGASVRNMEMTPGTGSGLVNVRTTLRRGG